MGNQCPECQVNIDQCKMRDVFKQQPKNRNDLDISHIKKGDYKKKQANKDESIIQVGFNFSQSAIIQHKLPKNNPKQTPKKSQVQISPSKAETRRPLTLQNPIQTLQIKKGIKYTGRTVDKQPHESGKITWPDGTTMNGQFFLGQLAANQKIRIDFPDGSYFHGQIVEGKANGKGKFTFADGSYIQGDWKDDKPHGYGKHKTSTGEVYEGNFQYGVKAGKGKLFFDQGLYEGSFQNNSFNGEGIIVFNDGRNIKGMWRQGVLEGSGQMQWPTGESYRGEFSNNLREGEGTYYFNDGRHWTGQWQNDLQNGFGTYQLKGELIKSVWASGIKKDELRQIQINKI